MVLSTLRGGSSSGGNAGTLAGEHPLIFALTPGGARSPSRIAQRFGPLGPGFGRRLEVPGRWHSAFGAVTAGSSESPART
jgi:hypothetical protein